jgi:ElaB/YqjD/DUF883 family membrane-anchored ribosome-binding protein
MTLINRNGDSRNAVERSLRETRKEFDRRVEEVRAELKEIVPEAAEKVEESLNDLKKDLVKGFDNMLHGRFEENLETGREKIREHPLLTVGIAVAGGVLVGMLLGKSKD